VIIHSKRLIFVHIQKTGGNAIRTAFGQEVSPPEKHFFACDLMNLYGVAVWDAYFKFAIVRNPWDRLVSWWSMIAAKRAAFAAGERFGEFQNFILKRATTFPEFLENCDEEIADVDGRKWIYRNQIDYLTDASGQQIVDFVGRFERLQDDFEWVTRTVLGEPVSLPHVNRSQHQHYSQYYTPALVKMVAHRFERDIEKFQYTFE